MDKSARSKEILDDSSVKSNNDIRPGLITDDPVFAAIISSFFNRRNNYFPVFSLPRMARNDWEIDVLKRVVSIKRARVNILFCKKTDYGLLAPLRTMAGMDLIALEQPEEVTIVLPIALSNKRILVAPNNYLLGLKLALKQNKLLEIHSEHNDKIKYNDSIPSADTVVVIEQTDQVTDVCAINYAHAKGWDALIIDSVSKEIETKLKELFITLSKDYCSFDASYEKLKNAIKKVVDWEQLERKYKKIQFVTREMPLGILIESIPVAHIAHIQSELRFVDEFYYNSAAINSSKNHIPSLFFAEINSNDIVSEIPEIRNILNDTKVWQFTLGGKHANRENFGLYAKYFPYDLLLISGHGNSPRCREVIYSFEDLRGCEHKVKLLEYYQFGPTEGEKILVETKEYFLEFDGIDWNEKEKLNKIGIGP